MWMKVVEFAEQPGLNEDALAMLEWRTSRWQSGLKE